MYIEYKLQPGQVDLAKILFGLSADPGGIPVAKTHIHPLGGSGSKAQLILFDNGCLYVVKFKGNLQGFRVLINELIASRLGRLLGVPVGEFTEVRVPQPFINFEPDMDKYPFIGGLQFGSLYYENAVACPFGTMLEEINKNNPLDFALMIVFDHLINNWDRSSHGDNVLYIKDNNSASLVLIDHGHAFGGPDWTIESLKKWMLPVEPLYGNFYRRIAPYITKGVFLEPLERIEKLQRAELESIMVDVPLEWRLSEPEKEVMIDFIMIRKRFVRKAIRIMQAKGLFPN